MSNDNNDLILAEITKTVVTLDRGMEAMYMLVMRHDEVLLEMKNRIENLEKLLHVSKGGLIQ